MWWQGMLIGFSIAAPVGPIGVLCIRRTLADGRLVGLVSGLGAATADAFYGMIAAFGLTVITAFLVGQQQMLQLVGGVFLCYLGVRTLLAQPAAAAAATQDAQPAPSRKLLGAYVSTLALTITNPLTILSFAAVFAGLGVAVSANGTPNAALILVAGVFAGSALWWLLLSGLIGLLRDRVGPRELLWVNRISGAIILAFGVVALVSLVVGQRIGNG